MSIMLALYGISTVNSLMQGKKNVKGMIQNNAINTRIAKINSSFEESASLENQVKQFREFSESHAQLVSNKNVALMTGGISSKSSVFSGVEYENDKEYFSAVQKYKDNIEQIKENKRRADINADLGLSIANQKAMNSYNGFNTILNNAMSYYTYAKRESETSAYNEATSGINSEIGNLKSTQSLLTNGFGFGKFSALGGK